jgi:hypothetical protein
VVDWVQISKTDVSDFAVHDRKSYSDLRRVVAYHREFTLAGISRYMAGLRRLKSDDRVRAMTELAERVSHLRVTKKMEI